jgi:glycosyltransferase involved in cell wall biosynthesis
MKFAFISRILSYEGRGIQTNLEGLLRGMAQVPHEHKMVLFVGLDQFIPEWVQDSHYQVVRLSPNPKSPLGRLIWDHVVIGRACQRLGIDVLYAPAHIRPFYSPCSVVVMIPDMMYHLFPQDWSWSDRVYFGTLGSLLTKRAAAITVLSKSTRSDVVRLLHLTEAEVRVIYPGTPEGFKPLPADVVQPIFKKYGLSKPFILYVGSHHPRKNLKSLVRAFEFIASDIPHDLVMVGPPIWQDNELKQYIKASPYTSRVRLVGFVPREALPLFFNAAEVFVFPSRYEGFGLPVLEAMACGCPVVTTQTSSLPEVAGDAAILVSPDDVPGLGGATLRVLKDNSLRERMRKNGLQQAGKFCWERTAKETIELLEKVAEAKR